MKRKEKLKDFKRMKKEEILSLLNEKRESLRQFYFDLAAGKIKNIKQIRETKKDIARLLTILNQPKST